MTISGVRLMKIGDVSGLRRPSPVQPAGALSPVGTTLGGGANMVRPVVRFNPLTKAGAA